MVSLTGFSLVGGPAYSDASAAAETLAKLDVPYVAAHVTEFQTVERWEASDQGLLPIETTIMVAIPELDGATGTMVYGGRTDNADGAQPCVCARDLRHLPDGPLLHDRAFRAGRRSGRPDRKAGGPAQQRPRRAQGGADDFQLPAERRQHGHRRLPFGV
jgi:hypothetical protein